MTISYSKTTKGFYNPEIHGSNIPGDAVDVTVEDYAALMDGQARGRLIVSDRAGYPVLAEQQPSVDYDLIDGAWVLNQRRQEVRIKTAFTAAVQAHMESQAQSLGYDSLLSAISYADEPAMPKFQQEGQALRAWRSMVWAKCYEVLDAVESGVQAVPTESELLVMLPALELTP